MGEYPPLSDEEITAISLCRARLENRVDGVTVTAEFIGQPATGI